MPSTARGPFRNSRTRSSTTMLLSLATPGTLLVERRPAASVLVRVDLTPCEAAGEDVLRRGPAVASTPGPPSAKERADDHHPQQDPERRCKPPPVPALAVEH